MPIPSVNRKISQKIGGFCTIAEALDYAAEGETGLCFHDHLGRLTDSVTYRELRVRALKMAGHLHSFRFNRGHAVAIVAETSVDFLSVFYGCQYAGVVACPLPFAVYPGGKTSYVDRLTAFVKAANARLLILPDALSNFTEELEKKTRIIVTSVRALERMDFTPSFTPLMENELAYIQFSSGSTFEPKGIQIPQFAVAANVNGILRECISIGPEDRAFSWLPFYHDMGLVGFSIAPLFSQTTVDYISPTTFARRPILWLELISKKRCTITYAPVFGYRLAAKRLKIATGDLDLSCLRLAGVGGDMIDIDQLQEFQNAASLYGFDANAFTPSYGLAESTLLVAFKKGLTVERLNRRKLGEGIAEHLGENGSGGRSFVVCGRPLDGHKFAVLGTDGSELGERRVGRICIKGPSLMLGYCNPKMQLDWATDDGHLDTGDMGYLSDGELVITGRYKEMMIINGRNIWPQDIENVVASAIPERPSTRMAAFSYKTGNSDEVIVLLEFVSLNNDELEAYRTEIARALSASMGLGAKVIFVRPGTIPLTSSGKISRLGAKNTYLSEQC